MLFCKGMAFRRWAADNDGFAPLLRLIALFHGDINGIPSVARRHENVLARGWHGRKVAQDELGKAILRHLCSATR